MHVFFERERGGTLGPHHCGYVMIGVVLWDLVPCGLCVDGVESLAITAYFFFSSLLGFYLSLGRLP